ncbi:hypothetical protein BTVI_13654 [Pitangus sulphuratus]|nr:hypothetical protein BTVI_13654 [Pitangus sulphuratus]
MVSTGKHQVPLPEVGHFAAVWEGVGVNPFGLRTTLLVPPSVFSGAQLWTFGAESDSSKTTIDYSVTTINGASGEASSREHTSSRGQPQLVELIEMRGRVPCQTKPNQAGSSVAKW